MFSYKKKIFIRLIFPTMLCLFLQNTIVSSSRPSQKTGTNKATKKRRKKRAGTKKKATTKIMVFVVGLGLVVYLIRQAFSTGNNLEVGKISHPQLSDWDAMQIVQHMDESVISNDLNEYENIKALMEGFAMNGMKDTADIILNYCAKDNSFLHQPRNVEHTFTTRAEKNFFSCNIISTAEQNKQIDCTCTEPQDYRLRGFKKINVSFNVKKMGRYTICPERVDDDPIVSDIMRTRTTVSVPLLPTPAYEAYLTKTHGSNKGRRVCILTEFFEKSKKVFFKLDLDAQPLISLNDALFICFKQTQLNLNQFLNVKAIYIKKVRGILTSRSRRRDREQHIDLALPFVYCCKKYGDEIVIQYETD